MLLLGAPLYRSLLKEARALPDPLVAEHYRTHIRSSFHRDSVPEASVQAIRRVKAAQKLLRQLQAANDGYLHALTRSFETAYGLRGKGKHAALAPFLAPALPTRTFPPPLAALLTSPLSHLSRPPKPSHLSWPPTLPERANPASEEARLLGPLTIQRERAVRRRWWNLQTGKVRPPVAVKVKRGEVQIGEVDEVVRLLAGNGVEMSEGEVRRGWERLEALEGSLSPTAPGGALSTPLPPRHSPSRALLPSSPPSSPSAAPSDLLRPPPSPSSTRNPFRRDPSSPRRVFKPLSSDTKWHPPKHVTPRLLRRIKEGVAEKAVVLTLVLPPARLEDSANTRRVEKGKWEVSVSGRAKGGREKFREMEMDGEDAWWFEQGDEGGDKKKKGGGKKQ
ncbi:hypothetical protein JCM6882_000489 [Rhodosporidiobolus microsporus]